MRWVQLGMALLLLGLPCSADADADANADLDRARALVLQGKHGPAREAARKVLRRNLNDPEALQIVVATSCELGDEVTAKLAYKRLAPDVQSMAARHCLRRGIHLTGAPPTRAAPRKATRTETAPNSRLPWRIAFWSGLGLMVSTLISAAVLAAEVDALEDNKEDAIYSYRNETGDYAFGAGADVCEEAKHRHDAGNIRSICDDASSRSTTSNVLFGVSLAVAALNGYLYYRAYIKKDDAPPPRVSFSPTLSPASGGLSLRLTF